MITDPDIVERAFCRISEGQVHYRVVHGDPSLAPIVLLHASPSSSRSTAPLAAALAPTGRTIIAPDTLGNGDSPPPAPDDPDIAYFADSVARLMDALGFDSFVPYGAHTGARIACELAASRPDRVQSTVLDGIKEYDDATRDKILANYAPTVKPDDHGAHMVWAFHFVRDQALYFPHFERNPEHRLPGFMPPAEMLHAGALDVLKALDTYAKPYLAAFRYRALERLPLIKGRVLFLKAERELAVLNAAIEEMATRVANGTTAAVASTPEAKASAIGAFIGE
ncbi:alpha/beta fold hydrolase [Novosphingobium sp. PC22D]|uniref:alpha/beta fold hydrolase n=1 Tax=Novosphingobium sp. PC22D TaxID=1962403 RepID=UPI001F0A42E5|nr:alpha/beta fold hydrolase [Novosphingobium sp. PC22D]